VWIAPVKQKRMRAATKADPSLSRRRAGGWLSRFLERRKKSRPV
jgi:hypothetical protein